MVSCLFPSPNGARSLFGQEAGIDSALLFAFCRRLLDQERGKLSPRQLATLTQAFHPWHELVPHTIEDNLEEALKASQNFYQDHQKLLQIEALFDEISGRIRA